MAKTTFINLLLLMGLAMSVFPQASEHVKLEVGQRVERELAGGQTHSYQILLAARQYLYAVVEQRGIDVAVTLVGPDGKPLVEVDSPNGAEGPEPIYWIAETSGVYAVSVRVSDKEAKAGRYEVRIVDLRTATEQDLALDEARKLFKESETLLIQQKVPQAISQAYRALAIRENYLGKEHLEVAEVVNHLAEIHANNGEYAKAEPLYQRVLTIREKAWGAEHPEVANALSNLGLLYINASNYTKSEPFLRRTLEIRRKLFGEQHPAFALSLSNLARMHQGKGEDNQAVPLYQRALAIWEKTLKPSDPQPAASLNFLAMIYNNRGDYGTAEQLYRRALALREKAYGPNDSRVASVLNNLALARNNQGDSAEAEQLFIRALTIFEKVSPGHFNVANSLNNLGGLYDATGDFDKAESAYRRALEIRERTYGIESLAVANSLANLAVMYKNKGDYKTAESFYLRALEMEEKFRGSYHPAIATSLASLAVLYAAQGQTEKAVATQRRAAEISEFYLNRNLAIGSERQKLAFLNTFSTDTNWIVSLHVRSAPENFAARDLALTTLLRRKGRALDTMIDSFAALRLRATPQDQSLLDQLQTATTELSRLTLSEVPKGAFAERQARVKNLVEQVETLEITISNHLAEFRVQSQPISVATVQAAIPDQSALIEFFTYRPFDVKARRDEKLGDARYVAYVLTREGKINWVELGEVKAIDRAIDQFRQALRDRSRQDVKALGHTVERMVLQPLYPLLGSARRIFLSPDGLLNLLPFAALVDQKNRYLVERFSFVYLSSGRDLLRLQIPWSGKSDPLILADPTFNNNAVSQHDPAASPKLTDVADSALNFSKIYLPPLSATADEARSIKELLPQATALMREQATETALKLTHGPVILHIATHGFFLPDSASGSGNTRGLGLALGNPGSPSLAENPLLRSGLLLAGVQQAKSGNDDGILTAMEAAGLDLWGTKLVVLSACNTAVGEVRNGDGVYGLRRALVLAGAESLLMSLWPVSDTGTRDLMIAYYRALTKGEGRSEALRQVQLRMLSGKQHRHPYYWASFIQSGEWKNLQGTNDHKAARR